MSRQPRTESREVTGRRKRVPLGVPRDRLAAPKRKGYVRRWINDKDNRIQRALEGGWQFVRDPNKQVGEGAETKDTDIGSAWSQQVGTKEGGAPLIAYYMEIKEAWWKEDQVEKMKPVDEIEKAIKKGRVKNVEGGYVPEGGIKIS